jgi:hypothetical protein
MDLHLMVNGLINRNSALNALLQDHANALQRGNLERATTTARGFIVPTWTTDPCPSAPLGTELLLVEAHVFCDDPSRYLALDTTLQLLHSVLTDADASGSITTRCMGTSADVRVSDVDTIFRVATWEITPGPSQDLTMAQPHLMSWPCRGRSTTARFTAPDIEACSMN